MIERYGYVCEDGAVVLVACNSSVINVVNPSYGGDH